MTGVPFPALLTVVVPAYKEADTIVEALRRLTSALDVIGHDYEVLVISDGNTDGTDSRALQLGHDQVRVLHYVPNRGKGYALKFGASHARGDVVVFIDADLDIHPDGIATLLERLKAPGVDAVVASKIHPASKVIYPAFRRFQSAVLRRLIRVVFRLNVSDTQTGLKVFKTEVLRRCLPHVNATGFAFDLELLVLANDHGFHVVEGPVQLDFKFGSTTGTAAIIEVLRDISRLARQRRREIRAGTWLS